MVLAWLLARSPRMLPIPGSGSPEHVAENVAAAGLELSPDEVPRSPRTPDAGIPGFTGGDMEPIETIAWHEIIHQGELHDWRTAQLIRLGFPRPLAEAVADHVDWHEIAALVHRGCGPRLALNIVL